MLRIMLKPLQNKLAILLVAILLLNACALDFGSDDDTEEAPVTDAVEVEEPDDGTLPLTVDNYMDFLSVALATQPKVEFEGYPVGRFATYLSIDDIDPVEDTSTITHACDGAVGTAVTVQVEQSPEDGATEPLYGTAGDYTESILANCTRDGFTFSGAVNNTLTSHTEYDASSIGEILNFTLADSIETLTFTNYQIIRAATGEGLMLNGDYVKTLRYESEATFNDTATRNVVVYTDQITVNGLAITTDFAAGNNIEQQFTQYVQVDMDNSTQWSGDIRTVVDDDIYRFTIAMPTALTWIEDRVQDNSQASDSVSNNGSLNVRQFNSGQVIITRDSAVLTAILAENNQATVTLDVEGDGVFEIESIETITALP